MKWNSLIIAVVTTSSSAAALPSRIEQRQSPAGTGPYKAIYTTDSSLALHTIYKPQSAPADVKLPVLVWGNGACGANGLAFQAFLTEIASHGYFIIANGAPNGSGSSSAKMMTDSIDWVTAKAGSGAYASVDAKNIAAGGQSCGGVEAYAQKDDARVKTLGIFNSGLLSNQQQVTTITKPIFYFLGGSGDIAYQNGERDYKNLKEGVPAWKGNLPVGHDGTYWVSSGNGGKFAVAATKWLDWLLKNSTSSATFFTGNGAASDGWSVEKKNLDKIGA